VGLVTFICYGLGLNPTATGFLYLIIVLLQSLIGDFVSAAAVSIIADLCLNFFFIPPIFSLRVKRLIGYLGADLLLDYGTGHYAPHDSGAPGGGNIGTSPP